jgi:hypothetical protein
MYSEELKAASALIELINFYINETALLNSQSLNEIEDQTRDNTTIHKIIDYIEVNNALD